MSGDTHQPDTSAAPAEATAARPGTWRGRRKPVSWTTTLAAPSADTANTAQASVDETEQTVTAFSATPPASIVSSDGGVRSEASSAAAEDKPATTEVETSAADAVAPLMGDALRYQTPPLGQDEVGENAASSPTAPVADDPSLAMYDPGHTSDQPRGLPPGDTEVDALIPITAPTPPTLSATVAEISGEDQPLDQPDAALRAMLDEQAQAEQEAAAAQQRAAAAAQRIAELRRLSAREGELATTISELRRAIATSEAHQVELAQKASEVEAKRHSLVNERDNLRRPDPDLDALAQLPLVRQAALHLQAGAGAGNLPRQLSSLPANDPAAPAAPGMGAATPWGQEYPNQGIPVTRIPANVQPRPDPAHTPATLADVHEAVAVAQADIRQEAQREAHRGKQWVRLGAVFSVAGFVVVLCLFWLFASQGNDNATPLNLAADQPLPTRAAALPASPTPPVSVEAALTTATAAQLQAGATAPPATVTPPATATPTQSTRIIVALPSPTDVPPSPTAAPAGVVGVAAPQMPTNVVDSNPPAGTPTQPPTGAPAVGTPMAAPNHDPNTEVAAISITALTISATVAPVSVITQADGSTIWDVRPTQGGLQTPGVGCGEAGNTVINGHNWGPYSKYGGVFRNLGKLESKGMLQEMVGHQIICTAIDGTQYTYLVFQAVDLDPSDRSYADMKAGEQRMLTLYTCTNDGSQRVVLYARLEV